MSKISQYQISLPSYYMSHALARSDFFLRDEEDADCQKRIKQLELHIKTGDYFGTLATVLNLLIETEPKREELNKQLDRNKKDLIHLQKHYRILSKV